MPAREPDVDALREKLKSLGYLDAGVDRFVLAPARAGRSRWDLAWRSSLRIGILAGLLLGLSGALAAGVKVPGLITGVRDTLVLASLLAAVLGAAVGATALGVILAAARAIRWAGPGASLVTRVRPLALTAGSLVGAVCLAYLTFWWRAMDAVPDQRSWQVTVVALAVAAAVSLLLGHATATTTQAVITNEVPEANQIRRNGVSFRGSAALVFAAAVAAAGVLAVAPGGPDPPAAPPALTVVPTGARVLVFAVDGYDETIGTNYLAGRTEARAFSPLRRLPRQSGDPAREWTTIATGQPVERHGVTALEVRRVTGLAGQLPSASATSSSTAAIATATDLLRLTRPAINTGTIRREKTFWEVAAQAGLRTVAVNWWTSWPARDEDGTVLTERAVLRLQAGGTLSGEIAPAWLYPPLRARWPALSADAAQLAEDVLKPPNRVGQVVEPGGLVPLTTPVATALREAALVDAQQLVLFRELLTEQVDLGTVYLPGLDILGSSLRALAGERASTALLVESADAVRRYYEWLLGRIAVAADLPTGRARPETIRTNLAVVLVGHPGRSGAQAPAVLSAWQGSAGLAPEALTPTAGPVPPSPQGPGSTEGTLFDVAPTILHVLGVPLSRELPGQAIWPVRHQRLGPRGTGAVDAAGAFPAEVPTYGPRGAGPARATGADPLDEEMRERLRSLGYVR
jgi:hypothetical protein